MKKLIALMLLVLLSFPLVACSGDNSKPQETPVATQAVPDAGETGAGDGEEAGAPALIGWMKDGTFSFDFTLKSEYDGRPAEAIGTMAKEGVRYLLATTSVADEKEIKTRVLILEDATYTIDDTNRTIIKITNTNIEMMAGMPSDYSGMAEAGSGEGEVNGKILPYLEYAVGSMSVRYFLENNEVYAIEAVGEGSYSLMVVSNASSSAAPGTFDLPEGYTEMPV